VNIEHAKAIPMSAILEKLNCIPQKTTITEDWYLSPLREEKTASFCVSKNKNVWYDHGSGKGGDTINFVGLYLEVCNEDHTVVDALRWLSNIFSTNDIAQKLPVFEPNGVIKEKTLKLLSVNDLEHFGLKNYLTSRGIKLSVGFDFLKEVRVLNKNTSKTIIALGLKNEENGYEIRNAYFKNCIGKKAITFIRGSEVKPDCINIFEGMFDFLTVATINGKPLRNDSIVLNSTSILSQAYPYVKGYGYKELHSYMDNDDTGKNTTKSISVFCQSEEGLQHKSMQKLYANFNDVNEWHMHNLNLRGLNV
jgi:Toprim-like/CHC2 zinc finger